jgi:hypothetical protein
MRAGRDPNPTEDEPALGGRRRVCVSLLSLAVGGLALPRAGFAQDGGPTGGAGGDARRMPPWMSPGGVAHSSKMEVGGATLQIDFGAGALDLSTDAILAHIHSAAAAVVAYYGRFPVSRARVLVIPVAGRPGIVQGTTWGDMAGFQGFTRVRLGEHATAADLADDWMMTHELVHMAFPSLDDDQHWMEEGLSTYIEPIARVMTGELSAKRIWADMLRDMGKGEPRADDAGVDHTHTWGRTYWGGAMFCLIADVEIRKQTGNKKGLRDALRAIVAAGGTIDHDWPLAKALEVGDHATGVTVLTKMYAAWKDAPVQIDLPKLWSELGVHAGTDGAEFLADAPLAAVREGITANTKT